MGSSPEKEKTCEREEPVNEQLNLDIRLVLERYIHLSDGVRIWMESIGWIKCIGNDEDVDD